MILTDDEPEVPKWATDLSYQASMVDDYIHNNADIRGERTMINEELIKRARELSDLANAPGRKRQCDCALGKSCIDCTAVRQFNRSRDLARYRLQKIAREVVPQLLEALDDEVSKNASFSGALDDLHKGRSVAEQAALDLAEDLCNATSGEPSKTMLNALNLAGRELVEKMTDKELLERALALAEKPPEERYSNEEGLSVLDALLVDADTRTGPWDWCLFVELIPHFNARKLIPQLIAELRSSREDYDELEGISESNGRVAERLQADVDKLRAENRELAAIIECRDAQIKHHQRSWKINSDGRKQVTRKYDTLRNIAKRQVVRRKVAERVLAILVANGNVARHVVDAWTKYSVDLEKESHS